MPAIVTWFTCYQHHQHYISTLSEYQDVFAGQVVVALTSNHQGGTPTHAQPHMQLILTGFHLVHRLIEFLVRQTLTGHTNTRTTPRPFNHPSFSHSLAHRRAANDVLWLKSSSAISGRLDHVAKKEASPAATSMFQVNRHSSSFACVRHTSILLPARRAFCFAHNPRSCSISTLLFHKQITPSPYQCKERAFDIEGREEGDIRRTTPPPKIPGKCATPLSSL